MHDPPRTRTWNLRLRRPTPYPLGQRAVAYNCQAACDVLPCRSVAGSEGKAIAFFFPLSCTPCEMSSLQRPFLRRNCRHICTAKPWVSRRPFWQLPKRWDGIFAVQSSTCIQSGSKCCCSRSSSQQHKASCGITWSAPMHWTILGSVFLPRCTRSRSAYAHSVMGRSLIGLNRVLSFCDGIRPEL